MTKFKVGDKVVYTGHTPMVGGGFGSVGTVDYVDTAFFGEGHPVYGVVFSGSKSADVIAEDKLKSANAVRSTNAVVAKALNSARNADLSAVLRDLKPKFEKYERECRQIAKALRALPKGPDRARKAESLMPKVRELYQDGAIGEMTRPLSAFADPEAAQIRISHERSMGEAKRELWGALRDAGLLAQATNSATDGVYEKAINDATGRTFKAGDKVRWEYVGGETDSGVVIADKGSYLEVKTDSGEVAHPAKILIAKNASSRKFKPNDIVEWIDRHGNRNGGYYVRDNGPDRVTVSIERDGQGGGLEVPRAWIIENARACNARSRNSVVQKALNAKAKNDWVKSNRSALGYQWRETAKERGIKSALRFAGAKSVDYLPWNHGTVKAGNYDTLSWVVEAPEEDINAVAAKMKQLGLFDISKPSLADYGDFYVVGYQKIAPIPESKNATAKNYDVKPGWTTQWSGDLKEGTKVAVVDSPARYGGMEGVVLRKDGYKYAVRLADIAGMEVQLNPNQLAVKNATATDAAVKNAQLTKFEIGKVYRQPGMLPGQTWLAKVLSRTDHRIKVAIKAKGDKSWGGKDDFEVLRIDATGDAEKASGHGWNFWADMKA